MQYARLQEDALRLQVSSIDKEGKKGLLQRFFGSQPDTSLSSVDSSTDTSLNSLLDTSLDNDSELSSHGTEATELDITAHDGDGELMPGFSAISGHVTSALNHLIENLTIPSNAVPAAEKVQKNIRDGLNWYELGPTIDDVANLVISAVGKGQKDFETFLLNLDSRLAKLQGFLVESQTQQLNWHGSSSNLDKEVREQVLSISEKVRDAHDIDHLKVSVSTHIESIISSMDTFVTAEDTRVDEMNKQMEVMQQRLVSMESEAGEIRERLKVERVKALTDVLTGLANREAYEDRVQMEFERWKRYRQPAAIVVADIDLFKRVNDEYGHLAGDKVIQIIAKEIANRIRKTDFVARFGGEEFVILFIETKLEDAIICSNNIRKNIAELEHKTAGPITVSFGVTQYQDNDTLESLFKRCDDALYIAKENGRNRVESV